MTRVFNIADYKRKFTKSTRASDSEWYYKELDKILDELFEDAVKMGYTNWNMLSKASGLSYGCVEGLGERITRRPQLRTVLLLANLVNKTIVLRDNTIQFAKPKLKLRAQ